VKDATPDPFHAADRPANLVVNLMAENRILEFVRDPTLESPSLDYFEVRMPWVTFAVTRASAERIVEAMTGFEPTPWVRAETVSGSVIWVRTEAVVYVREWTEAQRASEDGFWKQMDAEAAERNQTSEEADGGDADGPTEGGDPGEGAEDADGGEEADDEASLAEDLSDWEAEEQSPWVWTWLFLAYLVGRFLLNLI
jgi:hypothetical protein